MNENERIDINELTDLKILKKTLSFLKPYKKKLLLSIILMILSMLLRNLQPLFLGKIIDFISMENLNGIKENLLIILIIVITSLLFTTIFKYLMTLVSSQIEIDVRSVVFKNILALNINEFDYTQKGEFITKLDQDVNAFSNVLTDKILIFIDIGTTVFIGFIMFKIHWLLTIILLSIFPFTMLINYYYGKKIRKEELILKKNSDTYYTFIHEALLGFKTIKIFTANDYSSRKHTLLLHDMYDIGVKKVVLNNYASTLSQIINIFGYLLFLGVGAYLIIIGQLTIGSLIAFNSYSTNFSSSLLKISSINTELQVSLVAIRRILDITERTNNNKINENKSSNLIPIDFTGDIHLKNVSFGYTKNVDLLKNISINIPSKRITSILGQNGSGKTTLLNLLVNLYEPSRGVISIGRNNYGDISQIEIIKNISYVTQECYLFSDTIENNLLIANGTVTKKDIIVACKTAKIHDFISSLKYGYQTKLGEDGFTLSLGQKQRLSFARAILKNTTIYLFDEATASIDKDTENIIKRQISTISKNSTVVLVSHSQEVIDISDHIIVLSNGEVEFDGSYKDFTYKNHNVPYGERIGGETNELA